MRRRLAQAPLQHHQQILSVTGHTPGNLGIARELPKYPEPLRTAVASAALPCMPGKPEARCSTRGVTEDEMPGREPSGSVGRGLNNRARFFGLQKIKKKVSSQLLRAAQFAVLGRRDGERVLPLELHRGCRAMKTNTAQGPCLGRVIFQCILGHFVGLEFAFRCSQLRRKYQQLCSFSIQP